MKKTQFIDNDLNEMINGSGRRLNRYPSPFRIALAHLITLLGFIGLLGLVFVMSYFGIQGGLNEMERQQCESYQAYIEKYPESNINENQVTRCAILGIEVK